MLFLTPCDLDSCSSLFASWRPVIQLCCTVEAKPGLFMLKLYFCIFSIFPKLLWARTKIKKEMKMLGSRLTGCRLDVAKDWPPSFPFERQKEKKEWERERRYGKRRRRRSSPTPHFFFPLASSPSLPSLCLTFSLSLFHSFFSLTFWEKVEGQRWTGSEFHSFGVCAVKFGKRATDWLKRGTFSGTVCGQIGVHLHLFTHLSVS